MERRDVEKFGNNKNKKYISGMENNTKAAESNKVAKRKKGTAYDIKRLNLTVEALKGNELITEEEEKTLQQIANNMLTKYMKT